MITGAGRGIGTGIAEALAEAGADVAVNARTQGYAEPFARALEKRTGRRILTEIADVTIIEEVEAMVKRVVGHLGKIDILVNNLGDSIPNPLLATSAEEIRKVLDLNMMATIYCTRAVGKHMLEQQRGKVINISSFAALRGYANRSLYTLAKTAVLGFTRSLAQEWASSGIQVNAIAPGIFPDPVTIGQEAYEKAVNDAKDRIPMGRVGELREAGLLAVYLASPASDYMTGQVLCLDGGLTL